MNITAEHVHYPTQSEIRQAIIDVTNGSVGSICWPGILKIYRDESGETVVENLEETIERDNT